jgi:thymidylate synthase (FAD)
MKVFLIGSTQLDTFALSEYAKEYGYDVRSTAVNHGDWLAELAGRICYLSFNKRAPTNTDENKEYLQKVLALGHGSIFEHTSFNFVISEVSRNLTHELVRHRVGVGISQTSTRYCPPTGNYTPPELADFPPFNLLVNLSLETYKLALAHLAAQGIVGKAAQGIARHCLLGSTHTSLVWTCNARELLHVLMLRGSPFADPEIRELAVALYELVKGHNIFAHLCVREGCICI